MPGGVKLSVCRTGTGLKHFSGTCVDVGTKFRYLGGMSFLTLEVEIDHGHIVPKNPEVLPEKASGLLTILSPLGLGHGPTQLQRPMGLAKGRFVVPDNFNEPLPDDVTCGFEGR